MSSTARTTDAAALALEYGDRLVLGAVREVHGAVARRAFRATRLIGSRVPEAVHDAVAGAVYGSLSGALRVSGSAARSLASRGVGAPMDESRLGRQVRATVNGLVGDELRLQGDPQAIAMALRRDGVDVPATPWHLRHAHPDATGHVVVFVHGLCENEESWLATSRDRTTYLARVTTETDATPVLLRYNTGLHVAENGQHLDLLLEQLVGAWPVAVHRITLVGHSMGGLVVRAATNRAIVSGHQWAHRVGEVVCLGAPHAGATIEKAALLGSRLLWSWPQTLPLRAIAAPGFAGTVDLRHGCITPDDWEDQDLTGRWGPERIAAAPLAHAAYHFVDVVDGTAPTGALLHHPRIADWLVAWVNARPRHTRRLTSAPVTHVTPM